MPNLDAVTQMDMRVTVRFLVLVMYLCYAEAAQLQKAFFPADAKTQTMTFGSLSTTLRLRDRDFKSKPLREEARRLKRYGKCSFGKCVKPLNIYPSEPSCSV